MKEKALSPPLIYVVLVTSFAAFCLSQNTVDPDLWGHVRFGLDIIASGAAPRVDTFSYTARGLLWVDHEWLSEVVFGGLYLAFGPPGILGLKVVGVVIFFLLFRRIPRSPMRHMEMQVVLSALVVSVCSYGIAFRPQIFSYLLFTVLIAALLDGRFALLCMIPGLFILWANIHGGFLAGFAAVGLFALFEIPRALARRRWRRAAGLLLLGAASVAATLVNPYGRRLWWFLVATVFTKRPFMPEWRPIPFGGTTFMDFKALAVIFVAATLLSRERKRWWLCALTAACAASSFLSNRHMPFFAVCCAFFLPARLDAALDRFGALPGASLGKARRLLGPCYLGLAALMLAAIPLYRGRAAYSLLVPESRYPVKAVRWMEARALSGNCAVFFDWGEYLLWHGAHRLLVSIDGRFRTVYPEGVIEENFRFYAAAKGWERLLTRYPTSLALLRNDLPITPVMEMLPDWRLAFRSRTASVFVRDKGGRKPEPIEDLSECHLTPFP